MNTNAMIETVCNEIKQNLTAFCEQEDFKALTPEGAERMSEGMGHALAARGVAGFRAFLLQSARPHQIRALGCVLGSL